MRSGGSARRTCPASCAPRWTPGLPIRRVQPAAALFGAGVGSVLVPPPLIDAEGWRIGLGCALLLAALTLRASPMNPLLGLAANPASGSAATAAGLLAGTGLVLIAVTTVLASRLR